MWYLSKHWVKIVFGVLSLVTFVIGCLSLFFAFQLKESKLLKVVSTDSTSPSQIFYTLLLALSMLAVFNGVIGILIIKFHKIGCIALFGILSFVISFSFLILGSMMVIMHRGAEKAFDDYCAGTYDRGYLSAFSIMEAYDDFLTAYTKEYMCSVDCACDETFKDTILPSTAVTQTEGYTSFNECYLYLLETKQMEEISPLLLDFVEVMEEDLECSSICQENPFYFYNSISNGLPQKTCLQPIKDELNNILGKTGYIVLFQGILVFFAFNAHFGFWKKENRQKDKPVEDDEEDDDDLVFEQEEAGESEMEEMAEEQKA